MWGRGKAEKQEELWLASNKDLGRGKTLKTQQQKKKHPHHPTKTGGRRAA